MISSTAKPVHRSATIIPYEYIDGDGACRKENEKNQFVVDVLRFELHFDDRLLETSTYTSELYIYI